MPAPACVPPQLVLLRYSGQDEVTEGVPTAGRERPETHWLVGYFVNPMPIRAAPAEGATFADMARGAAEALLAALSHCDLPLQEVVEASGVRRQPGINPLFQVGGRVGGWVCGLWRRGGLLGPPALECSCG